MSDSTASGCGSRFMSCLLHLLQQASQSPKVCLLNFFFIYSMFCTAFKSKRNLNGGMLALEWWHAHTVLTAAAASVAVPAAVGVDNLWSGAGRG